MKVIVSIKEIIKNNQGRNFNEMITRDLVLPLNTGKIISAYGARRSGKTHLLYLAMKSLLDEGLDVSKIIHINFEDERLTTPEFEFDKILQAYRELFPDNDLKTCYFFFDEIQNIEHWEKFVRRINEDGCKNIFITGSNSKFLSTEIATELRGRTIPIEVYPLNFGEYLRFSQIDNDIYSSAGKARVKVALRNYLRFGGFPEILEMDEFWNRKVLQEYYNVMIYRDIIDRYNVSQPVLLKYFIKKLYAGVTKPVSINKVYNDFKSNKYTVGKNTLYDFFEMLQAAYMIVTVEKFDHSEIRRENLEKKVYAIDSGLLSAVDFTASDNWGKLLENMVLLEWLKYGKKTFFYKQTKECDLIWEENGSYQAAQICYSLEDEDTQKRELAGLYEACNYLGINQGMIITWDETKSLTYKNMEVSVVPAYQYILEKLGR